MAADMDLLPRNLIVYKIDPIAQYGPMYRTIFCCTNSGSQDALRHTTFLTRPAKLSEQKLETAENLIPCDL